MATSTLPGSGSIGTGLRPDPITSHRNQYVDNLMSTPDISSTAVSQFIPTTNATTGGVDVSFSITDITGIGTVTLLRAPVMDISQGVVLNSWPAAVAAFTWSDTDSLLQQYGQVYYWLKLSPVNPTGQPVIAGPEFILLNPSLLPPIAASGVSASHAAAVNGTVLVTCNVSGVPAGNSIKIYVTGYEGNPSAVAVAQGASSPIQFVLDATGETITIEAIAISQGGAEAASGPTTTLVLNGPATAPAKPEGIIVSQIASGNQITWPANVEVGVTGYQIYRGQRGDSFLLASLLATVMSTGEGTVEYLDTGGLAGDYQYFIVAVAGAGNSVPSDPASPVVLFSSNVLPPNVSTNTTNTATIDSIDAGSNVLVRIYGPGGIGTGYMRLTGYGNLNRPNGSISGLAYTTKYVILYDTINKVYLATTTFPPALPDSYEWVGVVTTTAAGGAVGTGATGTAVVDALGHLIQINAVTPGSGYVTATVNIAGGGGSGAAATANVVAGGVTSYTVTNGGTGYSTAPGITVTGTGGGGTVGGGGNAGTPQGCVELGTDVIAPEGTVERLEPCSEWIVLDLGDGPMAMHPDTLVSVWKKARELDLNDRVETIGASWETPMSVVLEQRQGTKVKRTCPGGTYHAGPSKVRLHNVKFSDF